VCPVGAVSKTTTSNDMVCTSFSTSEKLCARVGGGHVVSP
jgi:hypothetical protein